MIARRRWVAVTIRTVFGLIVVGASTGRTHADEAGLTFFGWSDQHVAVNGDGQHLLTAIDAMNSLPGTEFPAEIGGRVAAPTFVLGCGDITEWPSNAAKNTYDGLLTRRLLNGLSPQMSRETECSPSRICGKVCVSATAEAP